jgi:hypothetical protein
LNAILNPAGFERVKMTVGYKEKMKITSIVVILLATGVFAANEESILLTFAPSRVTKMEKNNGPRYVTIRGQKLNETTIVHRTLTTQVSGGYAPGWRIALTQPNTCTVTAVHDYGHSTDRKLNIRYTHAIYEIQVTGTFPSDTNGLTITIERPNELFATYNTTNTLLMAWPKTILTRIPSQKSWFTQPKEMKTTDKEI